MHVNFYKKPQIKTHKTPIKVEKSVLFLDYLEHFISNSATKRVKGYETPGLGHNTNRTIHRFKESLNNMSLRNLRNYT